MMRMFVIMTNSDSILKKNHDNKKQSHGNTRNNIYMSNSYSSYNNNDNYNYKSNKSSPLCHRYQQARKQLGNYVTMKSENS